LRRLYSTPPLAFRYNADKIPFNATLGWMEDTNTEILKNCEIVGGEYERNGRFLRRSSEDFCSNGHREPDSGFRNPGNQP
jgi:hypothetical protein